MAHNVTTMQVTAPSATTTSITTTIATTTPAPGTAASPGAVQVGDTIWLRAHTGMRLTVEGTEIHARWDHRGSWQAFVIEKAFPRGPATILSGDAVYLRAHTGNRVTVEGTTVNANWNHTGECQRLVIEKECTDSVQLVFGGCGPIYPNDTIYLKAYTGKRIAVEGTMVQASWDHMGHWSSRALVLLSWQALVLESDDAAARITTTTGVARSA